MHSDIPIAGFFFLVALAQWGWVGYDLSQNLKRSDTRGQPEPEPNYMTKGSELKTGQRLVQGEQLVSPNQEWNLRYQPDGNLVITDTDFRNKQIYDATNKLHTPGYAVMQEDGNFVIYDSNQIPVWASNTAGRRVDALKLTNYGTVILQRDNGNEIEIIL
jgi:hypothetical protein